MRQQSVRPGPRTVRLLAAGVLALLAVLAVAGCGGGTMSDPRTQAEEPQSVAPLPADWHHHRDYVSGFSLGVPPAWRAKRNGDTPHVSAFNDCKYRGDSQVLP